MRIKIKRVSELYQKEVYCLIENQLRNGLLKWIYKKFEKIIMNKQQRYDMWIEKTREQWINAKGMKIPSFDAT